MGCSELKGIWISRTQNNDEKNHHHRHRWQLKGGLSSVHITLYWFFLLSFLSLSFLLPFGKVRVKIWGSRLRWWSCCVWGGRRQNSLWANDILASRIRVNDHALVRRLTCIAFTDGPFWYLQVLRDDDEEIWHVETSKHHKLTRASHEDV